MMPISSIVLNSALATASLSGGNLRALAYTGGPVVVMKCSTPWRTEGLANSGRVIAGNSSSIRLYGSSEVMWCKCRAGSSDRCSADDANEVAFIRRRLCRSTSSALACRKSAPRSLHISDDERPLVVAPV